MSEALLKEILSEVKNIRVELDEVKQDMHDLKQEVHDLKAEQQLIKQAVLETNERLKIMEESQRQQDSILDVLSYRSIEQEAMIKRFH